MRIIQAAGYSSSGKTTLVTLLTEWFTKEGLAVGVVKHHGTSSAVPEEEPGTDTYAHLKGGAQAVTLATEGGLRLTCARQVPLEEQLDIMKRLGMDIVLIEGWKNAPYAKIEVVREGIERPPLENVKAVAGVPGGENAFSWEELHNSCGRLGEWVWKTSDII
ncbi:molybdopterin-guanine dinucleotide biosynthesis protein B [Alkalicoccus urumqiensis]|uniref:Molybdopterin-guanine dinucleotide biosynthesis protein B n=1 Tax=Alkalicoccus urumqiensis TaxID=1548213 RepID=A0A2P6MD65_ALKUR|nr:molybdopterin-guanine dinucleotide biosynthesis protein B [Alkalicoccus urumqiensis]PRO64219.1 molybdopterin-guanine dinucleotide biosynthesis protein B [Alkalicoccus urumqiensis]